MRGAERVSPDGQDSVEAKRGYGRGMFAGSLRGCSPVEGGDVMEVGAGLPQGLVAWPCSCSAPR